MARKILIFAFAMAVLFTGFGGMFLHFNDFSPTSDNKVHKYSGDEVRKMLDSIENNSSSKLETLDYTCNPDTVTRLEKHKVQDKNNDGLSITTRAGPTLEGNLSELECLIHNKINNLRAEEGLSKLKWDNDIARAARAHSKWLAVNIHTPRHKGEGGSTPGERIKEQVDYCANGHGENVAPTGYQNPGSPQENNKNVEQTAERIIQKWLNSPGHRRNIYRQVWDSGGVGVYYNPEEKLVYATHDFCVAK